MVASMSARGLSQRAIDDRARHADRGALLPLGDGRGVDRAFAPRVGRYDEQRGVGGAQPGAQLADEVAVAGGVDEVDLVAVVQERGDATAPTERCWRTAAGSWSQTVVPSRTVPGRGIAPVCASSASTSVVFPDPDGPTRTTLRIRAGSVTVGAGVRPPRAARSRPDGGCSDRPWRTTSVTSSASVRVRHHTPRLRRSQPLGAATPAAARR